MSKGRPRPAHGKNDTVQPLPYARLLKLSEDELTETYPHGAKVDSANEKSERWIPAQPSDSGIGTRTLKELLHEKKVKLENPRYLHRNPGAAGPRWARIDGKMVLDPDHDGRDDYTERTDRKMRHEDLPVPDDVAEGFAQEAENRWSVLRAEEIQRRKVRSLLGRLRTVAIAQTKAGSDPTPALEQLVQNLEREQAS